MGAVIVGLVANQDILAQRYGKAVSSVRDRLLNSKGERGAIFWFLSTRGYYIDTTFSTYAEILEHAHEKIIQMQENRAGILPAPILLRRWNSGLQGDFLARYARHVNWEASILVSRLRNPNDTAKPPRVSITHSWAHYSTSRAKAFSIRGKEDHERSKVRFGMIRSAYFYLEQPVLFPLLYHECAHLHFPSDEETLSDKTDFFRNRRDAYQVLSQPGIGGSDYDNFWDHYTEEVWADSLAIALSGRSYLAALTLQLFCAVDRTYFSHEDLHSDQVFSFDTLAESDKKIFEAAFPIESEQYFWEARVRVATRLCAKIYPDKETLDFCQDINQILDEWHSSGKYVFNAEHNSIEHEKLWLYRSELNEWVANTLWLYLEPTLTKLCEYRHVSTINYVSAICVSAIYTRVDAFLNIHFHASPCSDIFSEERLENVALNVRLKVAGAVASIQLKAWDRPERNYWTKIFANWCRHDGSTAFRLALEWYLTRLSLVEEYVARLCAGKGEEQHEACMPGIIGSHEDTLVSDLKSKKIFNLSIGGYSSVNDRAVNKYIKDLDLYADEVICALCGISLEDIKVGRRQNLSEVNVGTLSLGVLRTSEIVRNPPSPRAGLEIKSPYMAAINRVREYFESTSQSISRMIGSQVPSYRRKINDFHHMVGEYQFVTYVPGRTPTERDYYPRDLPSILLKPRMVLQVLGEGIKPPSQSYIGKVTLIRFQYRAKWFRLLQKIKAEALYLSPSMFISSAWEDVILVTWHASDEHLWNSIENLEIAVLSQDVDTQSSVILPLNFKSDCDVCVEESDSSDPPKLTNKIVDVAKRSGVHIAEIRHRLGRSDLSINWSGAGEAESVAAASVRGLACLPMSVWKRVSGFNTVYEKRCSLEDSTNTVDRRRSVHRAITIISMKEM